MSDARRYVPEVGLNQRNRQPEPYLGPSGIEARDSLVLAVDRMDRERALGIRLRAGDAGEFRPGYLARVRERIAPKTEPLIARFRKVGESR